MTATGLRQKLDEIAKALLTHYIPSTIGVLSGGGGVALFQFHYALFRNAETHYDAGVATLEQCIEQINNRNLVPTFCSGMAGLGWTLEYLCAADIVELDVDALLDPVDIYLHETMKSNLKKGDWDMLHGATGYGFYFLQRYRRARNAARQQRALSALEALLLSLEVNAVRTGATIAWETVIAPGSGQKGYNLGLAHGIPSLICFLAGLCRVPALSARAAVLLRGAADFMMASAFPQGSLCFFPNYIAEGQKSGYSRLAWCYGDPGIGIALWHAGTALEDHVLMEFARDVLLHAARRKDQEATQVRDACICHGAFGNARIFHRMYRWTQDERFASATRYWLEQGLQLCERPEGIAGYQQYRPVDGTETWSNEMDLLEGIAGIGLVIQDYLAGDIKDWDECLMLSIPG